MFLPVTPGSILASCPASVVCASLCHQLAPSSKVAASGRVTMLQT